MHLLEDLSFSMGLCSINANEPVKLATIPELIDAILSYSDRSTCAKAAAVCRLWCSVALDHVWERLATPIPLMRLLGPFESPGNYGNPLEFQAGYVPSTAEWENYQAIATRVRALHYDEHYQPLSSAMLMSLMRTISSTPYRHLLPNARRLTWVTHERDPATLAAFLGPSLRSFLITSHANNRSGIRATLGTLAAWLPESLEVLKMRFPNVANFYPELSGVLDTILRKHVHLKALELHLSFLEGVSPLTTLIERVPSQLQSLKLSHSIFASDMPPAMQVVASSLPNLRSLSLDLDIPSEGRVVRMELFQALLGIGNLVALELNLEPPLALSDSDVVSMGKAWPTLTDLKIYPSMSMASMHYHPFATSLSVLPIFADAFGTTLRHLGHNFTIPDGFPEALQGMIEGRRGFRKLQTLDLGTTIIPPIAVQGAAALIQAMCPSSTALQASRVSRKNSWMGLRSDEDWAAVRDDVDQIRRTGIVKKAPELSVDDDAARPSTSRN